MPSYRWQTMIGGVLSMFYKDEGETGQEHKQPSSTSQGARSYGERGSTRRTGTHKHMAFRSQEEVEVAMAAAAFQGFLQWNG